MSIVKKTINAGLRAFNYELRRCQSPADYLKDPRACPRGLYCRGSEFFLVSVPLAKMKDSRLIRTWAAALSRYPDGGRAAVRNELRQYFESAQPQNVAEVLKLRCQRSWHHNHPLTWVMPWQQVNPEQARKSRLSTMKAECKRFGFADYSEADGWKGFGPVSDALIDVETNRLTQIYDSLVKDGFQSSHGYTTARLYLAADQYLVSPDAGWHRIAGMIALGYEALPMLFQSSVRNIRREDYSCWPGVQSMLFSESEALEVFDTRFRSYDQGLS